MMVFRNAKELRAELDRTAADRRKASYDKIRQDIAEKIEANKTKGSISILPCPQTIKEELIDAGYKVEDWPACGAFDHDSMTISW